MITNTRILIAVLLFLASGLAVLSWKNSRQVVPSTAVAVSPSPSVQPSDPVQAENIFQIIVELTQPMVWSEPQPGIAYNGLGQKVTGVLIGTNIPANKTDNKVIPLLGSNSPLNPYGWQLNQDESASGKDGEIIVFQKRAGKSVQKLIFRSGVFSGEYKYYVLLSQPSN